MISQATPLLGQMQALLRQGLRREIEQVAAGNGADALPLARKVHTEDMDWNSEDMLMDLLQELWIMLDLAAKGSWTETDRIRAERMLQMRQPREYKETFLQNLANLLSEPTTK